MTYQFSFQPYHIPFCQPLQTHHGWWQTRSGLWLQLRNAQGQVGWGEVAPLEWFGSESFDQALAFCQQLPLEISVETIVAIPNSLPACQFGFETALTNLLMPKQGSIDSLPNDRLSALLPTGKAALESWQSLWAAGHRTFKWKIGVADPALELDWLVTLLHNLPATARLRLDANGGLTLETAEIWLQTCEPYPMLEFLEQPLPPSQFAAMLVLANRYNTPLALDESVATLSQLQDCHHQGWRRIFVVKPAIVGFPSRFWQFCQHHTLDLVFSSVFETTIGYRAGLALALELANPTRAIGFGTRHWMEQVMPDFSAQIVTGFLP